MMRDILCFKMTQEIKVCVMLKMFKGKKQLISLRRKNKAENKIRQCCNKAFRRIRFLKSKTIT